MKQFILLLVLASGAYGQVPKGWRVPTPADIKGQWSKNHWDKECQQAKDLNKKTADDAVEYTGNPAIDTAKDLAELEGVECWKPETFPVHSAKGDYNGDGVLDEARILISVGVAKPRGFAIRKSGMAGFFIFLNSKTGPAKVVVIGLASDQNPSPQDHFVVTQPPVEKLETWCGRGGRDCKAGEPASITLKRDSVVFGQFESWSTIAYWSARDNEFKVIALSD